MTSDRISGMATAVSGISSSTISPPNESPGVTSQPNLTNNLNLNLDDISALAARAGARRAEQLLNERLSAANQAHELTTKMLDESTKVLSEAGSMLDSCAKMMESITAELNSSSTMHKELEGEVANIKGSAISALSIFVSFFAFITVSINVFAKAGSVISASALVLIFWSLLVGFNVVIGWQFNTLKNTGLAWFLLILVSGLSVLAVVGMYYFSPEVLSSTRPVMARLN